MDDTQWLTFRKYAKRVKTFRLNLQVPRQLQLEIISSLQHCRKDVLPLLPNVTELDWIELSWIAPKNLGTSLFRYFASSAVTKVTLSLMRCPQKTVVMEGLYSFASWNVPDGGRAVFRCRDESSRVGRKVDSLDGVGILPVLEDLFVRLCIPHKDFSHPCPRCDPSVILGHSDTADISRFHSCHLCPVFHSPHLNHPITTGQEILAIR